MNKNEFLTGHGNASKFILRNVNGASTMALRELIPWSQRLR